MEQLISNKKGSEKLFSIWWFLVLAIVGVGIVAGVYIFYSSEVDIKEIESEALSNKLIDCVVQQGFLIDDFLKADFDVFETCKINKEIIESGDFYFRISLYDTDKNLFRESLAKGTSAFEVQCEISENSETKEFPRCLERTENILYYEEGEIKKLTISVLTGSNQKGRKLPIIN